MNLYINGVGCVSAFGNFGEAGFGQKNELCEPSYTEFIPPMQLRRMSKAVRMSMGSAHVAMKQAGLTSVEAITVGTALACVADTELFMGKMVQQDEQMLTPTAFIQSTHNTVSGQVALGIKCTGHNFTFVHKSHSFAHALVDAQLYLSRKKEAHILCGAIDECSGLSEHLMNRVGALPSKKLAEGAAFFVLSSEGNDQSLAVVKDLCTFKTTSVLQKFVSQHQPDYFFGQGISTDMKEAKNIETISNSGGDFPSAAAVGLALAVHQLRAGERAIVGHEFCGFGVGILVEKL